MKFFTTLFSLALTLAVTSAAISQCPGFEDTPIQVLGGDTPDIFYIPSTFEMSVIVDIAKDLPEDLKLGLQLTMLDPFPLDVPCIDGLGSCPYDLCSIINNYGPETCQYFPGSPEECGCPLLTGLYDIQTINVNVPDFGEVLTPLMIGSYTASALIYSQADPATKLGCFEFEFEFAQQT